MKFIHCSDLHLDASLDSKLSATKAAERRGELLTAFARLAQTAEDEGVTAYYITPALSPQDVFPSEKSFHSSSGRVDSALFLA